MHQMLGWPRLHFAEHLWGDRDSATDSIPGLGHSSSQHGLVPCPMSHHNHPAATSDATVTSQPHHPSGRAATRWLRLLNLCRSLMSTLSSNEKEM